MNRDVIVTCALTGAGDTAAKSPHVPVTPQQIASDALLAAAAGASIVHVHVRDPDTGLASRDPSLFVEVHDLIREQNKEVILNFTGGMGGDLWFEHKGANILAPESDFVRAAERIQHIIALRPEIGSMDCGSLNFGEMVYATTPDMLRAIAGSYLESGVKTEIEVFELGHIEIAKMLIAEGLIPHPPLFQLCLGVKHGAPATPAAMMAMRDALPQGVLWTAFGVGRMQFPMLVQAILLGGHVRVGLEDNLYLERDVLATNETLVRKAVRLIEELGVSVSTPQQAREILGLRGQL